MVRLVFRPYTQLRQSICTSESLRTSIRVSPDFILARHSSPSFGSQHLCFPPFLSLYSTVVSVQNMPPLSSERLKRRETGEHTLTVWCSKYKIQFTISLPSQKIQRIRKLTTNPTATPFQTYNKPNSNTISGCRGFFLQKKSHNSQNSVSQSQLV